MRTLVFWLTLAVGACGTRAADLHLLQTDGPSWNRLNLVFFAEGYTHGQTDRFLQDCTNALWGNGFSAGLLNTDPFSRYAAGFNAYAVFVSSPQEGADRPALNPPVWVNTYFDATFGPTDWVLGLAASGRARLNTLLDAHFPTNAYPHRFPIVLVNTPYQDGAAPTPICCWRPPAPRFWKFSCMNPAIYWAGSVMNTTKGAKVWRPACSVRRKCHPGNQPRPDQVARVD